MQCSTGIRCNLFFSTRLMTQRSPNSTPPASRSSNRRCDSAPLHSFDMPLNLYRPAPAPTQQDDLHKDSPAASYDLNFVFPVPNELRSEGVLLLPLIVRFVLLSLSCCSAPANDRKQPSEHAEILFNKLIDHPTMFRYLPCPSFSPSPSPLLKR